MINAHLRDKVSYFALFADYTEITVMERGDNSSALRENSIKVLRLHSATRAKYDADWHVEGRLTSLSSLHTNHTYTHTHTVTLLYQRRKH